MSARPRTPQALTVCLSSKNRRVHGSFDATIEATHAGLILTGAPRRLQGNAGLETESQPGELQAHLGPHGPAGMLDPCCACARTALKHAV